MPLVLGTVLQGEQPGSPAPGVTVRRAFSCIVITLGVAIDCSLVQLETPAVIALLRLIASCHLVGGWRHVTLRRKLSVT